MKYVIEEFYNVIEAVLITGFISMYFDLKTDVLKARGLIVSFGLVLMGNTLTTIFNPPLFLILFIVVVLVLTILERFYQGSLLEHLLIAIISFLLIILTDMLVFTIMSNLFDIEYSKLVHDNSLLRFMTVITTKTLYLIIVIIIISFKRKYSFLLHRIEGIVMSLTLLVSISLMLIFRNIIYHATERNYNIFLFVVLCLLFINICQYYTMIYISKKNISEQKLSLLKMQVEMQEENIQNLKEKYDETSKLRHDIKNYLSCSLEMAEHGDIEELINYLKTITEKRVYAASNYYNAKRKVIGAVVNSKLGEAENKGFHIKCLITDEMDSIPDIDIGIMLANLLDNAIEACEKNKGESDISLKTWSSAGYYCLEINNTVEMDILSCNPHLATVKKDKKIHGVGLKSVRDIIDKYDGMINFEQKSNKFCVYASLKRQNI